jgi:GTP-binding protein
LPQLALLGRSNVGKSSLLNSLIGRRSLARTSKTPGKTRALNVYQIDGRFCLVDLPGYGFAKVSKSERAAFSRLINAYLKQRSDLLGVVWLLDIRRDPSPDDIGMAERIAERGTPTLVAVTKADKVSRAQRRSRMAAIAGAIGVPVEQCVFTSARTKEGVAELVAAIEDLVREGRKAAAG